MNACACREPGRVFRGPRVIEARRRRGHLPSAPPSDWFPPHPLYRAVPGMDGSISYNKITGDAEGYVIAPWGSEKIPFSVPSGQSVAGCAQRALRQYLQKQGGGASERGARPRLRPRAQQVREVSERRYRLPDVEPIILAGKPGSKCKPFLQVVKNDEAFASCNALADEIGPLNDPKKVFRLLEEAIGDELSEVFGVMTLDLHGRLKGMTNTGMGEASSVMAPMIPTLRAALLSGGGGSILYHCHPSGIEAEPSDADIETTEAFDEAFDAIGMPLIDHCIVGGDVKRRSYFSFAESGLL